MGGSNPFTGRRPRPRRAEAWPRPPPSPWRTGQGASRRPERWGAQERGRQRTPVLVGQQGYLCVWDSSAGGTYKAGVADELASQPEEGLLEVVVGLGGDVVVLQVLLAVEGDGLGLDLSLLDVDLVAAEDDRDVLADTDEVTCPGASACGVLAGVRLRILTVPVGNVLVGDTGGHIEHDDTALPVDVVTIAETTELLLSSRVPHVELDLTVVLQFRISFGLGFTRSRGRY